MPDFDLIIIGGGPGGYVAAIRAAQLGKKVACVEKRPTLGGVCLNVGCIPSKALLYSSEKYAESLHSLAEHGVECQKITLNLDTMLKRKDNVVKGLTDGIKFLFQKNKVTYIQGTAAIKPMGHVVVEDDKGKTQALTYGDVIIATGSESASLPGLDIDEKTIVSSTGALSLPKVPKHLVVIGAGYIGLELGSVWQRLGAKVTVIEYLNRITPGMDLEISQQLYKTLQKQGIEFKLDTKVVGAKKTKNGVELHLESAAGGNPSTLEADVVLVAVGRKPFTEGLELEALGVQKDQKGFILVDDHYRTSIEHIHAIGDVIPGPMLAHKAEEEGIACVEQLYTNYGHVNYNAIPGVIYTYPEVASVGATEEQLKEQNIAYNVGKFPFKANSRARAMDETDGMVKILADQQTDRVLGAHIIGPEAGTLIAELVTIMEFGGSSEDVARTCHAHPTLNEAVKEAALAVDKRAIHI